MFKKQMFLCLAALSPFIAFFLIQMSFLREKDIAQYKNWVKQKQLASSDVPAPTSQHRKEVQKDIWFSQDATTRLHYQIASEGSLLTMIPIKNKFEIVEILQGIQCWMQDKLYSEGEEHIAMQQARLIEAKEGQYRYTSQEFVANDVSLSLFRLTGHELPTESSAEEEPFLQGIAHDISFLFCGKTPQFQAHQFQATMVKE